jgi:hypothetical protein
MGGELAAKYFLRPFKVYNYAPKGSLTKGTFMCYITTIMKAVGDTPTIQIEDEFTLIDKIPKTVTLNHLTTQYESYRNSSREMFLGFDASKRLRAICLLPYGPIGAEGLQKIILHLNKMFMPKKFFYAQNFLSKEEKGVYAIKMINRLVELKGKEFLTMHLNNFGSYKYSNNIISIGNATVMDCRSPILEHIMHFPARCKREAINRAISTYIAVVNQNIGPNEGYMPPVAHFVVFYAKNDKDALEFQRIYRQKVWLKIYNTHTLEKIGDRDE